MWRLALGGGHVGVWTLAAHSTGGERAVAPHGSTRSCPRWSVHMKLYALSYKGGPSVDEFSGCAGVPGIPTNLTAGSLTLKLWP